MVIIMSANHPKTSGFTLVEVLVAIAVAGVIILSLSSVTTSYLALSQRGRYLNLVNSFAEAKVEALRNGGFNALANGTTTITGELPQQLPRGKTAVMTVTSPSPDLKQVVISVTYNDEGKNRTLNYSTYIGELGVGQ